MRMKLFLTSLLRLCSSCSFVVTNFIVDERTLESANRINRLRGPDKTNRVDRDGWMFVHNLLWMTGAFTTQPFVNKDGIIAMFNGEIYNYQDLLPGMKFESDGYSIIPAFEKWGMDFGQHLDGEFALVIVDFQRQLFIMLSDPFGTKPLHFGWGVDGKFGVASLRSVLLGLDFKADHIFQVAPNTIYSASFEELRVFGDRAQPLATARAQRLFPPNTPIERKRRHKYTDAAPWPYQNLFPVVQWNLRQYKTSTDDWISAFQAAVLKRCKGLIWPAFVGLSSGFDSGAIHLSMSLASVPHQTFTVQGHEDLAVVDARLKMCNQTKSWRLQITESSLEKERRWISGHVDDFLYETSYNSKKSSKTSVHTDEAAIGISSVLRVCRANGVKVYFSGSGADEIISDYASMGKKKKMPSYSDFEGKFPKELDTIFPWRNFYFGKMRDYLMKEEMVGGSHSMETRYPFMDRHVVQEYLNLDSSVKNSQYKRPIQDFFRKFNYPFTLEKRGFNLHATGKDLNATVVSATKLTQPLDIGATKENNLFADQYADSPPRPPLSSQKKDGGVSSSLTTAPLEGMSVAIDGQYSPPLSVSSLLSISALSVAWLTVCFFCLLLSTRYLKRFCINA